MRHPIAATIVVVAAFAIGYAIDYFRGKTRSECLRSGALLGGGALAGALSSFLLHS